MEVHYGIDQIPKLRFPIVTSGTFDGVHLGHQKILKRLTELKTQQPDAQTVVITYFPHPRLVLFEQQDLKILNTLSEKIARLASFGVDHLLVIPFDKKFADQSSKEFVEDILVRRLQTQMLVIGYDHRFGKNREGSFEYLQAHKAEYGFEIIEIPPQDIEDVTISSTKIRNALQEGNITIAQQYLGSPYLLTGKVMRGKQIGRTIGFPTANLQPTEKQKLVPADGIYAVTVQLRNDWLKGMLYIGKSETIADNLERTIEVHLFDFEADIYDQELTVFFIKHLRGDRKFTNLNEMRIQLITDKISALEALK